ncbi:YceD family protein [Empedobacter stercoris]|uniref:YceD family protein n=1 Tax=Empedobacter stercoris TaxID=1628248 RepID=UPI0039ECB24B
MDKLKNYNIIFTSLPFGKSNFTFELSQSFFDLFEIEQDFENPTMIASIILDKKSTMLELEISLKGNITVPCDLTGELFQQEISNNAELIVKFGDEFDDTDFEIWVIPREEYQINLAQILYELAMLSVPSKRIHPDVLNGESNSEMIDLLDQYSIYELDEDAENDEDEDENDNGDVDDNDDIDPRWAKLKDLKP